MVLVMTGGMPEMVFEYILRQNGIDPSEVKIDQSIDFGSTAAAFSSGKGTYTVEFEPSATILEQEGVGYVVASLGTGFRVCAVHGVTAQKRDIWRHIRR